MNPGIDADALRENLARVRQNIVDAAARSGRDAGQVTLVAVSKTFPAEALQRSSGHLGDLRRKGDLFDLAGAEVDVGRHRNPRGDCQDRASGL